MNAETLVHPFAPVFDRSSQRLILGSFPSVMSRDNMFYYGNPRNRFWSVLAASFGRETPEDIAGKKRLLLETHTALWDVAAQCDIVNSADSSMKKVVPNDIPSLLGKTGVKVILLNGRTAEKYYLRFFASRIGLPHICLPSTSPANASMNFERLAAEWEKALKSEI